VDVTQDDREKMIADLRRMFPQYERIDFDPARQLSMTDLCKIWGCSATTATRRARKAQDAGLMRIIDNVHYPNGSIGLAFEFVNGEEPQK
jgi:hypothetical protein